MSNTEQCSNCRFWDQRSSGSISREGLCRRHAPESKRYWATTTADDWCGEHEPIERDEPEVDETLDERMAGSIGFDPHAGDSDAL